MRFLPQQPPGGKIGHRQGTRLVLLRTLTVANSAQTCRRGSRSGGRRWANYSTDSKAIMQKSRLKRPCTNQNRRIARSQPKAGRPTESKEFLWSASTLRALRLCPRALVAARRRSPAPAAPPPAFLVLGQRPGSSPGERIKRPSDAPRRPLRRAPARRGRTRRGQERRTARRDRPPEHAHAHSSTAQPHAHAHAHAHARGMAHGARRRAGGRAGSAGGRFGWYGGITAAVPFSARAIDVRARGTQGEDGRRGSAAAQRARCTTHDAGQAGGWLGGGRALGRCGAVLVCVAGLVQFGQLADLASYTQAQGGRAGRRARRRTAVCDAASPGSNRACWPIQERRWRGGAASAARAVWKERGRGKERREARPLKSVHFSQIRGRDLPTTDLARFDWSSRNILLIRLCSK